MGIASHLAIVFLLKPYESFLSSFFKGLVKERIEKFNLFLSPQMFFNSHRPQFVHRSNF